MTNPQSHQTEKDMHTIRARALREIERAFDAWENDETFGLDTDFERNFHCDADFIEYTGYVARQGREGTFR